MNQKLIKEVSNLIRLACNPNKTIEEILEGELGLGCRITHSGKDCQYECEIPDDIVTKIERKEGEAWAYIYLKDANAICAEDFFCCGKILGKPIGLEDVLLALKTKGREFYYANLDELARIWKLNTPLHEQEETTLLKIKQLLK